MQTGQPLPRTWLVTDERQGERLLPAIRRLPEGAGILFRHYSLAERERRALFWEIREASAGQPVFLAGPVGLAREWGAEGWHGWGEGEGEGEGPRSASVHDLGEIRRAESEGAHLLFLGPVHATRSHPGARTLGTGRFAQLAAEARRPVIALGGVTKQNAPKLLRLGAYGWGAVDAWIA